MAIKTDETDTTADHDRALGHSSVRRERGRSEEGGMGGGLGDAQLDLLVAALIGVAVGVSATLLLRRGSRSGMRPITPMVKAAAQAGARGARWVRDRGEEAWERMPFDHAADDVQAYARAARKAVDRALRDELKSLRQTVREQARRATH